MKKDILFLTSGELNSSTNLETAKYYLGKDITVVQGEPTIKQSFIKCAQISSTDLFVLIDADNVVLENATSHLETCNSPTIFSTTNKFGIQYGHGGIKVINKYSNFDFKISLDVTGTLKLPATLETISIHHFSFSAFNEWKTIFKELIKLYIWDKRDYLDKWLAHQIPKEIFFKDILPFLKTASMQSIYQTIFSNEILKQLYEKSNYCRNLQK